MNSPSTPTATHVRATQGIMSRRPPLATPPPSMARPAGCCRECVMSASTGQLASRIHIRLRGSTMRSLYPNMVPRSHTMTLGLPVPRILSAEFLITEAAQNWPFLMLITFPVFPAATRRSVWRQRKAGICMMSATCPTGSAWKHSWMSVTMGTSKVVLTAARILRPASMPGPRKDLALVRLALSKLDLKISLMPHSSVTCLIWRHILKMCSSDWMTLGPAIRKKGSAAFSSL
mmetsp:Transcript_7298/g.11469  ORF Transcript_7298/g.11469 Transcript_7298/m.11469 type:complete len:232 (-) Transcript_7298:104-799(-)